MWAFQCPPLEQASSTLPAHQLDKAECIFSTFIACLALKPPQVFVRLCQECRGGVWRVSAQQELARRQAPAVRASLPPWDREFQRFEWELLSFHKIRHPQGKCEEPSLPSCDGVSFPASFCHNQLLRVAGGFRTRRGTNSRPGFGALCRSHQGISPELYKKRLA